MPTEVVYEDFRDQSDSKLERFQIDSHDENCNADGRDVQSKRKTVQLRNIYVASELLTYSK